MGFLDVAFLSSQASFSTSILIIVEVKASWTPHISRLWLGVDNGMLPVKYFCSNKAFFASVELHGAHKTVARME